MIQNKLQVFVTRFAVAQISFLLTSPVGRLGTVQPCSLNFVRHFKEAQLFEVRGCQRLFLARFSVSVSLIVTRVESGRRSVCLRPTPKIPAARKLVDVKGL